MLNEVLTLIIPDKKQAKEFVQAVYKQLTGKSAYERNAEKVEHAIGVIDKTLGIDTVQSIKDIFTNGIGNVLPFGKHKKK